MNGRLEWGGRLNKVRRSIHAGRDRQFADRSNKISQKRKGNNRPKQPEREIRWLIGGYGCMIDCREGEYCRQEWKAWSGGG